MFKQRRIGSLEHISRQDPLDAGDSDVHERVGQAVLAFVEARRLGANPSARRFIEQLPEEDRTLASRCFKMTLLLLDAIDSPIGDHEALSSDG